MPAYLFAALRPSLPLAIQRDEAPAAFGLLSWGYRPSPRMTDIGVSLIRALI